MTYLGALCLSLGKYSLDRNFITSKNLINISPHTGIYTQITFHLFQFFLNADLNLCNVKVQLKLTAWNLVFKLKANFTFPFAKPRRSSKYEQQQHALLREKLNGQWFIL